MPLSKVGLFNSGVLYVNEVAVYLKQGSKTVANFTPTDKGVKQMSSLFYDCFSVNTFRLLDFSLFHDDPSKRYMDIVTHKK